MSLLQLRNVTVTFGGPPVLDGADLVIQPGERLCVLGRNGAGKTSLLRVLRGELEADAGEVARSAGLRTALLTQHVPDDLAGTVIDLVRSAPGVLPPRSVEEHRARAAISRVGLEPEADVASLSAGLKRRALLAAAIAADPDLLLLDEPTNHLDIEAIAWLEDFLARGKQTLVFVTHDRAFLRRIATGILDLDRGRLTRFPADYDAYAERKQGLLGVEERADALFDKRLAGEETWIRQGVRERRKRNMGRVRRLQAMREERRSRRETGGTVRMTAHSAGRSGRLVLAAKDVSFAWGDAPTIRGLTTEVMRGERLGIMGGNGSGKTTLLRLLLGELAPQAGELRHGVNLSIGYFDQLHAELDPDATAADNVSGGGSTVTVNGRTRNIIGYLRDFLFTEDQVKSPARVFSGGERNRLLLARLFARPSNVLVLDEPTNDLDVETLSVLEDLLADYAGTILIVSHDRELLDHVVTSTLVIGDGGVVTESVGGYSDWFARRAAKPAKAGGAKKRREKAPPARPKSKLTWAERKELETLPGKIEVLEAEQARRHEEMADPAFFRKSGTEIADAKAALESVDAELSATYARWEALEERNS
ncbi:MAG: ATP-binding cassette domain-containing protein [Planctomycetota bacterium]